MTRRLLPLLALASLSLLPFYSGGCAASATVEPDARPAAYPASYREEPHGTTNTVPRAAERDTWQDSD